MDNRETSYNILFLGDLHFDGPKYHVREPSNEVQKRGRKNARSLYVVKDIRAGETFTPENLRSIRPGRGLPTWHYQEILGKKAAEDLKAGTAMRWEYIEK